MPLLAIVALAGLPWMVVGLSLSDDPVPLAPSGNVAAQNPEVGPEAELSLYTVHGQAGEYSAKKPVTLKGGERRVVMRLR